MLFPEKKSVLYLSLKIAKKGELERQSLFSPLLESAPKDLLRAVSQVSISKLFKQRKNSGRDSVTSR